jgi:hypothetical protein
MRVGAGGWEDLGVGCFAGAWKSDEKAGRATTTTFPPVRRAAHHFDAERAPRLGASLAVWRREYGVRLWHLSYGNEVDSERTRTRRSDDNGRAGRGSTSVTSRV